MKLSSLLESVDKQALFHLQQRMIEDLPADTEISIINRPDPLGVCIRLMLQNDRKIRFFKPPVDKNLNRILVLTSISCWSEFGYDSIISLLNNVKPTMQVNLAS